MIKHIAKTSKGELLLREYLKLKYHWVKHEYNIRPDWLKWKTGNNLELDIYIPDLHIAFEFNSDFHLNNNHQKARDIFKRSLCSSNQIRLYTFSLQTLDVYVNRKGHTDGKYFNWYLKLSSLLQDYRKRFKNDKSVNIVQLPPGGYRPSYKSHGIRGRSKVYQVPLPIKHRVF